MFPLVFFDNLASNFWSFPFDMDYDINQFLEIYLTLYLLLLLLRVTESFIAHKDRRCRIITVIKDQLGIGSLFQVVPSLLSYAKVNVQTLLGLYKIEEDLLNIITEEDELVGHYISVSLPNVVTVSKIDLSCYSLSNVLF